MNLRQRQTLSRNYIRLTDQWAAKYEPLVAAVINKQIRVAVSILKDKGVRALRAYLDTYLLDEAVGKVITDLITSFALSYGEYTYKRLMRASRRVIKADSGAFGLSEAWNQSIEDFLRQFLLNKAVIPVTEGTKKQILQVLIDGQERGWGVDRIIKELENREIKELTEFRARRIVRTELSIAANFADKMVQDSVPFEVDKVWVSVHDRRTRDSHHRMDDVTVDGDADFHVPIMKGKVQVGVDLMTGPGDPEATPGNVINCRCTKALIPKRDKNGRLIPKHQKIAA